MSSMKQFRFEMAKLIIFQGRSQKFVFLGGYKSFWGWIKLLNSRSDVIFYPTKSLLWLILGGINPDIHPRRYAPEFIYNFCSFLRSGCKPE